MKKIISTGRVPIKLWLDDIEDNALEQAKNLANLPFVFKHVAIAPDCHYGMGTCIGSIMATNGTIVINAIGVDIACGVIAIRTSLTEIDTVSLKTIMSGIRKVIPVGFKKHKDPQPLIHMPLDKDVSDKEIVYREFENACKSLGTLGGGNHFIEIQRGDDGYIYIMIHSGSRNLGKQVADHYNKIAIALNEKWFSSVTKDKQLAFLPLDSDEGQAYLNEMEYCVSFARANRQLMMERIKDVFVETLSDIDITFDNEINIAHNYARMENHFGKNVMVHRKGATSAKESERGIIPGSQGSKSYIVRGLGNRDSFTSCSHGAGRVMGRKQAQRELNLADEIKRLDDLGVVHSIRSKQDLDEAPSAYKDINIVMENQSDLVEIVIELTPLAVIKG
jgi:tRNA-splicing ligase RtcB